MSEHARELRTVATWLDANDAPVHAAKMREIAAALEAEGEVVATGTIIGMDFTGKLCIQVPVDDPFVDAEGQRVQVRVVRDGEGEP